MPSELIYQEKINGDDVKRGKGFNFGREFFGTFSDVSKQVGSTSSQINAVAPNPITGLASVAANTASDLSKAVSGLFRG